MRKDQEYVLIWEKEKPGVWFFFVCFAVVGWFFFFVLLLNSSNSYLKVSKLTAIHLLLQFLLMLNLTAILDSLFHL